MRSQDTLPILSRRHSKHGIRRTRYGGATTGQLQPPLEKHFLAAEQDRFFLRERTEAATLTRSPRSGKASMESVYPGRPG